MTNEKSDENFDDNIPADSLYQKMKSGLDDERKLLRKATNQDLRAVDSECSLKKNNHEVISNIRELIDDYKKNSKVLKK